MPNNVDMKKNYLYISIVTTIALSLLLCGCAKEVEQLQPQEKLHKVVFYAGWAPETKTVLQEDGSVWWSPGDEISLFVGDGNNGGYKLASTNDEPSATADFIGNIRKKSSTETYTAIYPYNEANKVDGNTIHTVIPAIQTAKEGTFEQKAFVSIARSDNENLYFRNLCSGIKFSVKNAGIKKVVISTRDGASIAGGVSYSIDSWNCQFDSDASSKITVNAPSEAGFEIGKFYYAVLFPFKNDSGVDITFCTEDKTAVFEYQMPIEFKRGVFKRLYEKDADLQFHGSKAIFKTNIILPEGVDKTLITQAIFLTCNDTKTATVIPCSVEEGYEPIYFELDGTVAKYYTNAPTIELRTARNMFDGWKSVSNLDLSSFNTDKVSDFCMTFYDCSTLEEVNISTFNTEKGSNFGGMFSGCSSLKSLDVSSFNTSNAILLNGMFMGCKQLKKLDVSSFVTSLVTNFWGMFADCRSLDHVDVSKFDLSSAENVNEMFRGCYLLSNIDTHNWKSSKIVNMNSMFIDCRSVSSLDLSGLELSNVNNMSTMFYGCSNLADLKLSKDTPHLIAWGLSGMFADCQKLKSLDLSNFDTSNVNDFSIVFHQCFNLKSLNLNGWNTSNATNMKWMFLGCSSLQNVDLSMFDTSKVTNMNKLFSGCSSLKKLDLSNWNTSNVTDMSGAFEGCRNLEVLDISGFSSDHLSDVYAMFGYTHKLSAINMGDLDISSLSMENTFYEMAKNTPHCYIRCTESQKVAIEPNLNNSEKIVWITDGSALPDDISSIDESLYYSTDYSKDKTVKVLQKSSKGVGVDLVLMGDGYSDRMIASGEYDCDMERTVESIFQYEPFKSFRHLFNIYITYAVSENEVIGKSTAFDSYDTRATVGHIGSNDLQRAHSYSMNASGKGDPRDVAMIVVLNSEVRDGVCINFLHASAEGEVFDYHNDPNWDDYHGGNGYAVVSGPKQDGYEEIVIHEFGHMFGKLADEYVNDGDDYQSISAQEKLNLQNFFPYGMNKNIDVTDAPSSIKWSHFLSDSRYSNSGTGIFEGANQYRTGVWRPSENSIMRNMSGQFNAPSREAIYYRIHKLAYGKNWQYNFEDFVQWDLKNIQSESKTSAQSIPYPARVNDRKPFFKMEKVRDNDGREMIRMIMN